MSQTQTPLTYGEAMKAEYEKMQHLYSPPTFAEGFQTFIDEAAAIPSELDYDVHHASPTSVRDDDLEQHLEDQFDTVNRIIRDESGSRIISVRWSDLTPAEQRDAKTNIFHLYD